MYTTNSECEGAVWHLRAAIPENKSRPRVYAPALNVLPLAVFRSFSSLSGLARRRTANG